MTTVELAAKLEAEEKKFQIKQWYHIAIQRKSDTVLQSGLQFEFLVLNNVR